MNSIQKLKGQSGFSLVEVTVAAFLFSIILLVVLLMYELGNKSQAAGERASDMQQNTRVGFDHMMDELRMVGYDHDRDGKKTPYADDPSEAVEFAAEHAITIRANLDFQDADGGREHDLEITPSDAGWGTDCCPIVTVGNNEIITYALRSEDTAANTDSISIKTDVSDNRDAYIDVSGTITNEETLTIANVDLSGENPPYTLYRFAVNADGDGFVETPVADNIHDLRFTYADAAGRDYFCVDQSAIACDVADQVPFADLGGSDDINTGDGLGRTAREKLRAINVELIGMDDAPDYKFQDPKADPDDPGDMASLHHRKFRLFSRITPPNLGRTGEPDLETTVPDPPTEVTLCSGQCDTVRVEWTVPANATTFLIRLFDEAVSPPQLVYEAEVTGQDVPDSDPLRRYVIFNRNDDLDIQGGRELFATMVAMNAKGVQSQVSANSNLVTVEDVVRPDVTPFFAATGYDPNHSDWPDTSLMSPTSDEANNFYPKDNKIVLLWEAPEYTLDVLDDTDPANSSTTRVDTDTLPALSCDAVYVDTFEETTTDPDTGVTTTTLVDHDRTPLREVFGNERFLIFRSTNPRFVPTDDDLVAVVRGEVHPDTGKFFWVDENHHLYDDGEWVRTKMALPCCEPLYYRIRLADACWNGANPAQRSHPNLSPFFPRLNLDETSDDSDDISNTPAGSIGLAVPGYALPDDKPSAPWDLRYTESEINGTNFNFAVRFRAPKQDAPPTDAFGNPLRPSEDATYREYILYGHPSDPNYTLQFNGNVSGEGRQLGRIRVEDLKSELIAWDDEDQDGTVEPHEDETDMGTGTDLWASIKTNDFLWVRLVPIQCENDALATDSNGDEYAFDLGEPSAAIKVPCEFGGDRQYSFVNLDSSDWPNSVSVYASLLSGEATHARLQISMPSTGESAMTDAPGISPDFLGSNTFTFSADHIQALASRMSPGQPVYVSAEVKDSNDCYGFSNRTLETIGLPSCCIGVSDPVATISDNQGREAVMPIREFCNANITINRIDFEVLNSNGGREEKLKGVHWGAEALWGGNRQADTIDLAADGNPIHLGPSDMGQFRFEFDKDATLDGLRITLTYDINDGGGDCVFVEDALNR